MSGIYKFRYVAYDHTGKVIHITKSQKLMGKELRVTEAIIGKAIKGNYLVRGTKVLRYKANAPHADTIKPFKHQKNKHCNPDVNNRNVRMYIVYNTDGKLAHDKLLSLGGVQSLLGVKPDTILEGVQKPYIIAKHIVVIFKGKSIEDPYIPKRLSPLMPNFKCFQYDRSGKLINWYTSISVASRVTGVSDHYIRRCIKKGVSRDSQFFFTNHIPLTNYNTTNVCFEPKPKKVTVKLQQMNKPSIMTSIAKASKLIGISYDSLRNKSLRSNQFMCGSFIVEVFRK